jgi:outer membrane protein TolC
MARRTGRPDLSLGVDTRQYSGDAGLREAMVTLSMSLPWFNRSRYRRELERERFSAEAVRLEQAELESGVAAEVHHLVTAINSAGRELRLQRDTILARTRAALEIELGRWSAGGGELRDLLELHRQRVDAEVRLARASVDQWNAIAELLLCCGLDDLEAFLVPNSPPPSIQP